MSKGDQVHVAKSSEPPRGLLTFPELPFPSLWRKRAVEICFGSNTSASISLRDSDIHKPFSIYPQSIPGLQAR